MLINGYYHYYDSSSYYYCCCCYHYSVVVWWKYSVTGLMILHVWQSTVRHLVIEPRMPSMTIPGWGRSETQRNSWIQNTTMTESFLEALWTAIYAWVQISYHDWLLHTGRSQHPSGDSTSIILNLDWQDVINLDRFSLKSGTSWLTDDYQTLVDRTQVD